MRDGDRGGGGLGDVVVMCCDDDYDLFVMLILALVGSGPS